MHTTTVQPPTVLRSRYVHVRTLLVIATTAIAGLVVALVIVAGSNSASTSANAVHRVKLLAIRINPSAELGAKLDHSGRLDYIVSAELGAKLDHRGRRAAGPTPLR